VELLEWVKHVEARQNVYQESSTKSCERLLDKDMNVIGEQMASVYKIVILFFYISRL